MMGGIKIVVSDYCLTGRWVFPEHRFIEFSPEDESWARAAGYGYEVLEPCACHMGDIMYVHPTVYDRLRKFVQPSLPEKPNCLIDNLPGGFFT